MTNPPPPPGPYEPPPIENTPEGHGQPFGQGPPGGYPPPPPPGYGAPPPGYGVPAYGPPGGPAPDNYLVWSILCTVLCCLPLGIVAIINSSKVNGLWAAGQFAAAQKASTDAKKFAMWGAIIGAIVGVIYLIVTVATGMSAYS